MIKVTPLTGRPECPSQQQHGSRSCAHAKRQQQLVLLHVLVVSFLVPASLLQCEQCPECEPEFDSMPGNNEMPLLQLRLQAVNA